MPFVDLSNQQSAANDPGAPADDLQAQQLPAAPMPALDPVQSTDPAQQPVVPGLVSEAPAVEATPEQVPTLTPDQALSQNTITDDFPAEQSLGELNSLNMNSNLNSDAIAPEETQADTSALPALDGDGKQVEVNIDENGVKSMSGPALSPQTAPLEVSEVPMQPVGQTPEPAPNAAPEMAPAEAPIPEPGTTPAAPALPEASTIGSEPEISPAQAPVVQSSTLPPIDGAAAPAGMEMQPSSPPSLPGDVQVPPVAGAAEMPGNTTPAAVPTASEPPVPSPAEAAADAAESPVAQSASEPAKATVVENEADLIAADTSIEELTRMAKEMDASDIHFTANYPVMFRKDGDLVPITKPLNKQQAENLALSLLVVDEKKKSYEKEKEVDFSFTNAEGVRFRVNLYTERGNSAGALRLIATKIRTVEELELPDIFLDITKEPHGLVLVVGPTGSGKSTTLAAMINHINMTRREHILTIEDPIEYVYPIGKSIVDQRELEADTMTWQRALKSALREDPNIVLVGEMRDLDTIESTITIAETGHLVFATLHTNSAAQAIDRIIDVFPEGAKEQIRAQLASVITAVISQRLIPVKGGGRRAALEIMLGSNAVKNAIREGKTYQIDNILQTSGDIGMLTLEKSLVNMVKKGYITKEQALEHSVKPDDVEALLSRI